MPNALVSQKPLEYSDYVQEIILAYFVASLRSPPEGDLLKATILEWEAQFIEAGIPASKLMKVFRITMKKNPKFFTTGDILETWEEIRMDEAKPDPKVCVICRGTKKAKVMDFNTGKDVEVPCRCAQFIGK